MRQLSGSDAFHVLEESPVQHMHTMKIAIVDAAAASPPITIGNTREWAAKVLPGIAPLCWQLVNVPVRLGRPMWVDEPDLDVEYHVRRAAVPSPGGPEEFDEVVSEIASFGLDRAKPLWQLWLVEGLADGRVAFVFKMHHAIADGGASVRILEQAFGAEGAAPLEAPSAEPLPSRRARLATAMRNHGELFAKFPRQLWDTAASVRDGRARHKAGEPRVTAPMTAPMTRFNRPLTPNRAYVDVTVPLADLRAVKDGLGGTLNDVYIAMCGGAVRRYLDERDELPETTLTATSPVSIRKDHEQDLYGNRVSYWYVTLATHLEDPAERLAAVSASTSAAKGWAERAPELFADWQDYYVLHRIFASAIRAKVEKLSRRPAFNVIVSNVRGPKPLSHHGAPVVAVRSMGPLVGTQGINFTGWSYGDDFAVGLHACREHVPDLRRLGEHVVDELAALTRAAAAQPPTGTVPPPGKAIVFGSR